MRVSPGIFAALAVLLFATHASAGTVDNSTSYLIVETGATAEIKEAGDGAYTLTMTGVPSKAILFSDRPARSAMTQPVEAVWQGLNASDANPVNAALAYRSGDGDKVTLLEIASAKYDAEEGTLALVVRPLPLDHSAGNAINHKKETLSPGAWSDGVALFVDDWYCCATDWWGNCTWWCLH